MRDNKLSEEKQVIKNERRKHNERKDKNTKKELIKTLQ